MGLARLIRGQVLSLREREFIQAAQVIGAPTSRILFKELLPNLVAPIVIAISLGLPAFVAAEAGLSFLGIGLTGEPSLGQIVEQARLLLRLLPPLPLRPCRRDRDARARPEPAGRLGPRRVRPQDSPVTKVHRSGITTERVASTMRRTTRALVALSAAGALALSACGGDGDDGDRRQPARRRPTTAADTAATPATSPTRTARARSRSRAPRPAARSRSSPFTPLETMDPSEIYYVHTNSISTGLVHRSLTQFVTTRTARPSWSPTSPPTSARPTRTSPSGSSRSATA